MLLISTFIFQAQVSAQDIIINEIMASNQESLQDSDSDFDDWFELKNIGEDPVNLSGYYLSDKEDNLTRWQFNVDEDIIIEPGGYLLIWADDEPEENGLHTNFKLGSSGETLTLTNPDGSTIVDQINYPQIMTDVSYGRSSNDISKWIYYVFPTPGRENNFGISSYYWTDKIKFVISNRLISSFFISSFLIILILLISYYKTNKELNISKIKYEKLFEKSPVGLLICDIKGNIKDVNKEMVKLLGAPDKKAVKRFNLNDVAKVKEVWHNKFLSSEDKDVIEGEIEYTTNWNKDVYLKYKVEVILFEKNNYEVIIAVNDISREKKIEKDLEYLSFHDELTGLYNRRYFENEMERLDQSRNIPISIIIGDLDNLKYINDTFGHKKGDEYIIKAAEIIENNFRNEDIVARIGGDEFAIILPDTDGKTAFEIGQRIKEKCNRCKNYKQFGISIGHATKYKHSEDLEEVFIEADQELYKDKKSNY